jgi:peptidoglycan/xylan/chitin deacetylase (PgdA/CDA1 family)
MKYESRVNINKLKNIKTIKSIILFISIVLVVGGSTIIAVKSSEAKEETVQALEINQDINLDSTTQSDNRNNENAGNGKEDQSNKNETDRKLYLLESDPVVEDVLFIEKYLDQQMKGQKPDGVDGKKVVYLTFDDGPSETVTPKILDVLKDENVHATFFVVGKAINESETNKGIIEREVVEGNAIGNHTYSHNYNNLYPKGIINVENCMAEFEKTNQALRSVLGEEFLTRAIRFPGGHMTWQSKDPEGMIAMDKALKEKDYHQVDWNALSKDAEGAPKNAEQLLQWVINTVASREKAVILMHDTYGKEETAKALPQVIKYLKEQGYEFKTMK